MSVIRKIIHTDFFNIIKKLILFQCIHRKFLQNFELQKKEIYLAQLHLTVL